MKIQCACGAKYTFDITPERAQQPVQFVCPACGLDSSEYVTNLVREHFGFVPGPPPVELAGASPASFEAPPAPAEIASAPFEAPPPPSAPTPVVRLTKNAPRTTTDEEAPVVDSRFCAKHPGMRPVEQCVVCAKPLCPKCMELFGYVCSPLCKQKAELRGIEVPVYEFQKSEVERRRSRKMSLMYGSAAALVVAVLGAWFWWAWFGQKPRSIFAVRFEKPAYSGSSVLCGKNQIVFLHGGTLARHDLNQKKEIWSVQLVDKEKIKGDVEKEIKRLHQLQDKLNSDAPDAAPVKIPAPDKLARRLELAAAQAMSLRVVGENIWIASPGKLVRYDWDTGKVAKELAVEGGFRGFIERGEELLMLDEQTGRHVITHINLANATTQNEEIVDPAASTTNASAVASTRGTGRNGSGAGLPIGQPGQDNGKPLDPQKVEEQAARLSIPGRIALPAVLAVNRGQERALAEMNDSGKPRLPGAIEQREPVERFHLIPSECGYVEFSTKLLERRVVTRKAMRERPAKSALDGPVSVTATAEIANEILNDMQRDRGGDSVTEDESRYQVTLRNADGKSIASWTGEVIGHPSIFPLKSVNVVAGKRSILVLDKNNQKMWQAELTYDINGRGSLEENEKTGQGPCVERGDTLFVFDEGVLTSFDLKKGAVKWRLPSVGISGLFFDADGKLYVNSTTASPDSIKYSKQIDITRGTSGLLLKVEPATGKTLWTREINGALAYVSGKYIYTLQSYWPPDYDEEEENPYRVTTGLETDPFIRIRRVNPRNGKDQWVHFQLRCPVDVKFDQNKIHLVFKKEVQVLKAWSL